MRTQAAADAAAKEVNDADAKAAGTYVDVPPPDVEAAEARKNNQMLVLPSAPGADESFIKKAMYWLTLPFMAFYVQCKRGLFYDIFAGLDMNTDTAAMHEGAEVFNPRTEKVYEALQVGGLTRGC